MNTHIYVYNCIHTYLKPPPITSLVMTVKPTRPCAPARHGARSADQRNANSPGLVALEVAHQDFPLPRQQPAAWDSTSVLVNNMERSIPHSAPVSVQKQGPKPPCLPQHVLGARMKSQTCPMRGQSNCQKVQRPSVCHRVVCRICRCLNIPATLLEYFTQSHRRA